MKVPVSLAAMGLVVLLPIAAGAAPVDVHPTGTASPTPPIESSREVAVTFHRAPATSPALPDSVLARIFFARGRADVTRRQFVSAAGQFQLPPGGLTPELRRQILDLVIQKRILSEAAQREPRQWNHSDSLNYNGLSDRLTLSAALDSALADLGFRLAARGDSIPDRMELGMMLRDSAMATLGPRYDEGALQLVASAFANLPKPAPGASVQEQFRMRMALPSVSAADSARMLIDSSMGRYTVGELLSDFGRLNPSYRPQVRSADDVRDIANSVIYEKILRQNALRQDLVHRPDIAAQIADRAEFLDVQEFVRRSAYDRVPTDSVTLRRHFDRHPRWFDDWARADIVRGIFKTRAAADSFARALARPAAAESLVGRRMPSGVPYATFLAEQADTALFARVRRAGTARVEGPDETTDGWRVIRATRIEPRRPRTFAEARDIVFSDWYQRDGDRRVAELMRTLVASTLVQMNERAIARLDAPAMPPRGTPRKPPAHARPAGRVR